MTHPTTAETTMRERIDPVAALEPFAAMAREMQAAMVMSGGKATPGTKVMSASWEGGICVLTYGHFLDALEAFPGTPRPWGGMYRPLVTEASK